ncbi:sigma-70 family RNA polymerase sigma factor [Amycolatopsis sp. NPDC048633]|uniref:sigma-70 family RNA polymerase sigma factor n=1 Tax=Amycolatopsis sp. NPDC048633 TaxID=3157095 RepID=UPI00340C15DA
MTRAARTRRFAAGFGELTEGDAAALVARVQAGDLEALGELYRHGRERVRQYLVGKVTDKADVEDLIQETFLRAPEQASAFNPDTTDVGAWLCGWVARWAVVDYSRHDRFRQVSAVEAAAKDALTEPADNDAVARQEREATPLSPRMVRALAGLRPLQRRGMQLRFLDELHPEQAAEVAGTTAAAIKTACSEARKRLRAELADLVPASGESPTAGLSKAAAVRAALRETGDDMPAALAQLAEQGVTVPAAYARNVRDARDAAAKAPKAKGPWPQRKSDAARAAAREFAAEHGELPSGVRLAELAGVSTGTASTVLAEMRAQAERTTGDTAAEQAEQHDDGHEVSVDIPTQRPSMEGDVNSAATIESGTDLRSALRAVASYQRATCDPGASDLDAVALARSLSLDDVAEAVEDPGLREAYRRVLAASGDVIDREFGDGAESLPTSAGQELSAAEAVAQAEDEVAMVCVPCPSCVGSPGRKPWSAPGTACGVCLGEKELRIGMDPAEHPGMDRDAARASVESMAEQVRDSGDAVRAAEEAVERVAGGGAVDEDGERAERVARWQAEDRADETARADDGALELTA